MAKLIIFGCGYSGQRIARTFNEEVIGTTRSQHDKLRDLGIMPFSLDQIDDIKTHIKSADAIVISTPPPDPVIETFGEAIATSNAWIGYLSTTAVYGNRDGAEVDEQTPPAPTSKRGELRLATERAWRSICPRVNVFRLAGIYGPNSGPLSKIRSGKARKIIKDGQVFGRIHVDDIARVIVASYQHQDTAETYNLTDDLNVAPQIALDYAAKLLGVDPLPKIAFEDAEMTPMARSFYSENKRVLNTKIKTVFGDLLYPDYKSGLESCLLAEQELLG